MDENLLKKVSGQLYYVPIAEYVANKGSLPTYSSTGQVSWINAFDLAFDPETVGKLTDFQYSFGGENDETVYTMGCTSNNVSLDVVDRITNITATVASLNNYGFMSSVLSADQLTVVGSTVNVVGEAHGTGWVVGTPFRLNYANHNGTVVTNIYVYKNGIALVLNVDYSVFIDSEGYTRITPLTAQTLAITVKYDYTTASSEIMSIENKTINIPRTAYKFISCAYRNETDIATPWRRDVVYFTECKLAGELVQKYYKQGDSFEGSSVEFLANTGVAMVRTLKGTTEGSVSATP